MSAGEDLSPAPVETLSVVVVLTALRYRDRAERGQCNEHQGYPSSSSGDHGFSFHPKQC